MMFEDFGREDFQAVQTNPYRLMWLMGFLF